jgi:hypothetical protein
LELSLADIFHEVDEEVRREKLEKLWERYGTYVIALAVLVVAGIGAWRGYEWWIAKQAAAAGAKFEAALTLSEQGKHAQAEAAFAKIAAEAPSGYRVLARFRAAAELAQDKPAAAVAAYEKLADDNALGETLQDLAALRAGMLEVDSAPFAELKKRLDPLTAASRPFRASAREMLALSAWRHNDFAAAHRYIDMLLSDAATPPGARTRAEVLAALIAAGGKG